MKPIDGPAERLLKEFDAILPRLRGDAAAAARVMNLSRGEVREIASHRLAGAERVLADRLSGRRP